MKFEEITGAKFDEYDTMLRIQMADITARLRRIDCHSLDKLKLLNVCDVAKTYFSLVQEFYIGSFRDVAYWYGDYFCAYNELKDTLLLYSGYGFVVPEHYEKLEEKKGGEES